MVALPIVCWLFPEHRYTAGRYLAWAIGLYGIAKVLEHFDDEIFRLFNDAISGHTLKHFAAAFAAFLVLRMLLSQQSPSTSE